MGLRDLLSRWVRRRAISEKAVAMLFANMAKTGMSASDSLLWGYFFHDRSHLKLAALADQLIADGYTFVEVLTTDDQTDFQLHVEKAEVHSPASLVARCRQFEALAAELDVELFDGFDVGPLPRR